MWQCGSAKAAVDAKAFWVLEATRAMGKPSVSQLREMS